MSSRLTFTAWVLILLFAICLYNIRCEQDRALKNIQQHFILIERHLQIIK